MTAPSPRGSDFSEAADAPAPVAPAPTELDADEGVWSGRPPDDTTADTTAKTS